MAARKKKAPKKARLARDGEHRIVGDVVMVELDLFRPNDWNPNRMTPAQRRALRFGLETIGWLTSHAMTVWGTDEHGREQNVIIDGEHCWQEARKLGFTHGPAVILQGLTRQEAMAYTVKIDGRRGEPDWARLARSRVFEGEGELRKYLGLSEAEIARIRESTKKPELRSENAHAKMVPLFFDPAGFERFQTEINELSALFGTETVTDTVLAALRDVASA